MNIPEIYLTEICDDGFEYRYICSGVSLNTLREKLPNSGLNSYDVTRLKEIGGTIVERKAHSMVYLVDINFDKEACERVTYKSVNGAIRKIRLDLKLDEILK